MDLSRILNTPPPSAGTTGAAERTEEQGASGPNAQAVPRSPSREGPLAGLTGRAPPRAQLGTLSPRRLVPAHSQGGMSSRTGAAEPGGAETGGPSASRPMRRSPNRSHYHPYERPPGNTVAVTSIALAAGGPGQTSPAPKFAGH